MNNLPSNSGHSRGRGRGSGNEGGSQLGRNLDRPGAAAGSSSSSSRSSGSRQLAARGDGPPATRAPPQRSETIAAAGGGSGELEEDRRGAVRGRRMISDVVVSRPKELVTKTGSSGDKVTVQTNYFCVQMRPNWTIHQYRVDFSPDVDNTRLRRGYLNEHRATLGGHIFDGTVLFCVNRFPPRQNSPYALELVTKSKAGENIMIKIKQVGTVEAADNQQLQILNLILRRAMEGLKLQLVSRNYFDPQAKIVMENYNMEIWPGYTTSIRQHENDILLCTEIAHKVMRTHTLYQILGQTLKDNSDYQDVFKKQVVGTVVLTDYNNKTYRIDDVDFASSPKSTFQTNDGEISYIQYYKTRYNINIRDYNQPLLVSRPTEKNVRAGVTKLIMLIPELARATGMTDEMRTNFRLMKAMGDNTRLCPERRIERLKTFNRRLQTADQSAEVLRDWCMKLDPNLVEIPARILKSEKILFGNQRSHLCDSRADWKNEFRTNAMFTSVDIKRWIVITPNRSLRETQDFVQLCVRVAKGMRMHIAEPRYEEIRDDRTGSYTQAIDNAVAKDPQILMVVLKMANEDKYSCIKKRTCVERPIPSQVVTLRTIAPRAEKSGGLMSIATKVVIQMNAKLTGAPWMVVLPLRGLMTVGFDVCHSSKNRNKSFGALVATMDMMQSTQFFSTVSEHMKGQELTEQMSVNMTLALKAYRNIHGTLPERILFYRDGVGDGQLQQVVDTEVKHLKNKLDEIYKSAGKADGCKLAFIVVGKRINSRYFLRNRNPPPGTVVDDVITLPERYDFYLVSQSVNQGTVSPTNYNIIYDNMGMSADRLQVLTYKMTHLYYNWTGTLRVPAVCQYAHKLAFLVAESIHVAPSTGLENQLYFL